MDRHPLGKCGCDWQNGPDGKFFSSSSSRTSKKYIDFACLGTDQNYRTPKTVQDITENKPFGVTVVLNL